ncbi:META domain-containing protein [Rhodobacteraceae bacterium nBUS_24]
MPFLSRPTQFGPFVFSLWALLSGCQVDPTATLDSLVGPVWVVQTLDDATFPAVATLQLSQDGKVAGKAPCNRYFGAVKFSGSDIAIGPLASTRMACEALDDETRYLLALADMTQVKLSRGQLILRGPSGRELTFKKQN